MKLQALAVVAAIVALGALVSSCETMSVEECKAADWGQLGYTDGANNGSDNFANRQHSCADKGFTSDAAAYSTGFTHGMRAFCTPERGFSVARQGGSFNGQCAPDLADGFNYGFADGRRVHDAQNAIDEARSKIADAEHHRDQIDHDLNDRQHALDNATTNDERTRIRNAIDDLRHQRRDVNEDLRIANDQLPHAQRLMDDVRAEIGGRYGTW